MPKDSLARVDPTVQPLPQAVEPPRDEVVAKPVRLVLANDLPGARRELASILAAAITSGLESALAGSGIADLERFVGQRVVSLAQRFLALLCATACWKAMRDDLAERGLGPGQFRVLSNADGYLTVHTTFGRITFPVFAYYDLSTPAPCTRHPGRRVLPYHQFCHSSPLCLEWEVRLGTQHPFRKAEAMFHFFSRGASTIEDTTIERHILYLNQMVDPSWLYRRPEDIRKLLVERATRDKTTGRPLLYFSTDAHALRRYAGLTWTKEWRMVNGIRVWCEDAKTGQTVHLGGEFLWNDCEAVEARIRELLEAGVMPGPGADPAWHSVNPQIVFISDGADWFRDRILPLVPDSIPILDLYHLLDWFAQFGKSVYGVGSDEGRTFHAEVRRLLLRKRPKPDDATPRPRRGHKKNSPARAHHAHEQRWDGRGRPRTLLSDATAESAIAFLDALPLTVPAHLTAREELVAKIAKNRERIDYPVHLARGMQIGSGAMESMHVSGSQLRLKLPGATWLEETSQAVLGFRMLELSGRWDEFWRRKDIAQRIGTAFHDRRAHLTLVEA